MDETKKPTSPLRRSRIIVTILVILVLVLAVAEVIVARKNKGKEAVEDDAIRKYINDVMLQNALTRASRECLVPTGPLKGVLHVSTRNGVIQFGALAISEVAANWSPENKDCVRHTFDGFRGASAGLNVPAGREYELEIKLQFPSPTSRD